MGVQPTEIPQMAGEFTPDFWTLSSVVRSEVLLSSNFLLYQGPFFSWRVGEASQSSHVANSRPKR